MASNAFENASLSVVDVVVIVVYFMVVLFVGLWVSQTYKSYNFTLNDACIS